jgi:hypothetical protein
MNHHREVHWNHSITSGLHVPTQLNTRVYQNTLLYTLCLGGLPPTENPKGRAVHGLDSFEGIQLCNILKCLIPSSPSSGQAPAVTHAPAQAPALQPSTTGSSHAGTSLASTDEIQGLVNICQELQKSDNNSGAKKKR